MRNARENRTRFTAWISKYALTEGIYPKLIEDCFDIDPNFVHDVDGHGTYHKGQWHRTREEAVAKAKEMQARKLISIDKQRSRIAALTF